MHPDDVASMREPIGDGQGTLRTDISTAMVGLYKKHFGKGPTRCQTYLAPNLVTVILGEGYTPSEQTLFEAGKWYEVRAARQIWQDSMHERFVATIEELTRRRGQGLHERQSPGPGFRRGALRARG